MYGIVKNFDGSDIRQFPVSENLPFNFLHYTIDQKPLISSQQSLKQSPIMCHSDILLNPCVTHSKSDSNDLNNLVTLVCIFAYL